MLTERQLKLYNLLNTDPNKWFSQKEICDAIIDYTYSEDERNHCVTIGEDRIIINANSHVDKIIVTKKHCFKIANETEYAEEREKQKKRALKLLWQVSCKDRKYKRDGQVKLFGDVFDEVKEESKQYYETFTEKTI